jgi:RecB family exonuclease
MAELVNRLAWSASRVGVLRRCARLYYLRYYLFWQGWEDEAPRERRLAYALSKMVDLPLLVGLTVHRSIARHLHALRDGRRENVDAEAALESMRRVWRDARRFWPPGALPHSPSPREKPPVFEVYYGRDDDEERLREIAGRLPVCLEAYAGSAVLARLRETPAGNILWIERVDPAFDPHEVIHIDGNDVHCVPDLVVRSGRAVEIIDWKTGTPTVRDAEQIAAYALWVSARDLAAPANVRGRLVYLAEGGREEVVPLDAAVLERSREGIRSDLQEMRSLLTDAERNVPLGEERFPRRDEAEVCCACHYRAFCWPDGLPAEWGCS